MLSIPLRDEHGRPKLTPASIRGWSTRLEAPPAHAWVEITGGTDAFCEGLDLEALAGFEDPAEIVGVLQDFAALLQAIERHPRPVLARVEGPVLGGGVGVVAACDFVVAAPGTEFSLPEALVGLIPAVVLPTLSRRMAPTHARSLALGSPALDAEAACRRGLVDEVAEDTRSAARRHGKRWARMSPLAQAAVKELTASSGDARPFLDAAIKRFHELLASPASQARLRRFLAGEAPWPTTDDERALEES